MLKACESLVKANEKGQVQIWVGKRFLSSIRWGVLTLSLPRPYSPTPDSETLHTCKKARTSFLVNTLSMLINMHIGHACELQVESKFGEGKRT